MAPVTHVDPLVDPGRRRAFGRAAGAIVVLAGVLAIASPTSGEAAADRAAAYAAERASATFVGDFETGDHSQWSYIEEQTRRRIRVVRRPVREGRYASRHVVHHGDSISGGARAEVLWGSHKKPTLREGTDLYFGWSSYFPRHFPSPAPREGHSVFLQWKDDGVGQPPLRMGAERETLALSTPAGDLWSTPLRRSVWHDFVARVRFSADARAGRVELWHNGRKVVQGLSVRTLRPGRPSYLKLGYYRDARIRRTSFVVHDALRVGRSYAAVARR